MASLPVHWTQAASTASSFSAAGDQAGVNGPPMSVSGYRPGSILGKRPAPDGPFALPPMDRMLEYRHTETMGTGVFAKEDIPQGTRIVIEPPLWTMPNNGNAPPQLSRDGRWRVAVEGPWYVQHSFSQDPRYDSDVDFFCRRVIHLGVGHETMTEMETMCYDEAWATRQETLNAFHYVLMGRYMAATDFDTMCRLWGDAHCGYPGPDIPLHGITANEYQAQALSRLAVRYAKLCAIWRANHWELDQGTDADYGVFRIASRVNHSCIPNVSRSWVKIGGYSKGPVEPVQHAPTPFLALTLNTVRDIRCGEQILMAYQEQTFQLPASRQRELRTYGIAQCVCKLCTNATVGTLQYRAWSLYHATQHWLGAHPSNSTAAHTVVMWGSTVMVAQSAFEALAMAEELIGLLTHPSWDVRSQALAHAYKLASMVCERMASKSGELGMSHQEALAYWQKARVYSGRKIQVYIMLEGTDGPAMRKADEQNKELGKRRMLWLAKRAANK